MLSVQHDTSAALWSRCKLSHVRRLYAVSAVTGTLADVIQPTTTTRHQTALSSLLRTAAHGAGERGAHYPERREEGLGQGGDTLYS